MKKLKTISPAVHSQRYPGQGTEQNSVSDFGCTCCPVGRSGHRIIVTEDSLYSLGGFNPALGRNQHSLQQLEQDDRGLPLFQELWKFNLSSRQWQLVDDFTSVPPTIASHTIAKIGRWLFLFGGTAIPFGETPTSAIYRYDLQSSNQPLAEDNLDAREDEVALRSNRNRWHLVPVTGDIPEERYGHTMTMRYPDVYIVGGTSGYIYNAEVYHLDLRQPVGSWSKLSSDTDPKQPVGRYRHETAFKGNTLYVFGGGTDRDAFSLVHVPTFNVMSGEWGVVKTIPDPQHGHPASRKCHSCSQFENDVYLVGGLSGTSATNEVTLFKDVWRFSLLDGSWTKFSTMLPVPLYFHSADICKKTGSLWIFGGVTSGSIVGKRTNRLMCLCVKVGSLLELAWAVICDRLSNRWAKVDLDELGIPAFLQARLQAR